MAISMSFISCIWLAASGQSPSCINLRNQAHKLTIGYDAIRIGKHTNNIHTLNPWLQFEHNSGGKQGSFFPENLLLSAVGVMGGSLEIDGWGVQADW